MKREKAILRMKKAVSIHHQCPVDEVEFPRGLDLGTTWEAGQDFSAEYEVEVDGRKVEGVVYWSVVSQEAYI